MRLSIWLALFAFANTLFLSSVGQARVNIVCPPSEGSASVPGMSVTARKRVISNQGLNAALHYTNAKAYHASLLVGCCLYLERNMMLLDRSVPP